MATSVPTELFAFLQSGAPDFIDTVGSWFDAQDGVAPACEVVAAAAGVIVALNPDAIPVVVKHAVALVSRGEPSGQLSGSEAQLAMTAALLRNVASIDSRRATAVTEALRGCGAALSTATCDAARKAGMRKNAITAKSFAPFLIGQAPLTASQLHELVVKFIHGSLSQSQFAAQLASLWASNSLHPTFVVEMVLSSLEALGADASQRAVEVDVGSAFERVIPCRSTRATALSAAFTALKRADRGTPRPGSVAAASVAVAVRHRLITVKEGYALYCAVLGVDRGAATAASIRIHGVTSDLHAYAASTRAETILDMSRQMKTGMKDSQRINSARFFEIVSDKQEPTWGDFFGASESTADEPPREAIIAGAFAVELLRARAFTAAALYLRTCLQSNLNLFLVPRSIDHASATLTIAELHQAFWCRADILAPHGVGCNGDGEALEYFEALMLPMEVAQSHLLQQPALAMALDGIAEVIKATSASTHELAAQHSKRWVDLAVRFVTRVFFPCLRCLQGTPVMLHDSLVRLMKVLGHETCAYIVQNVDKHAFPHDLIAQADTQALLTQGLRRVTKDSVKHYTLQLRQVVYTNPVMVVEKLLTQAIGYNDGNLMVVHAQLIRHAPPSVLQLFMYAAVAAMKRYADEEREGAETRVGVLASYVAVVWRQNLSVFDPGYFIHSIEQEVGKETRASTLFATEALRAIFYELLHQPLETVEQFNENQLAALCAGQQTRWFGRGCAESFIASRWDDLCTPHTLLRSRVSLRKALLENGVGARIVMKLLRLQANLYELYADLSGKMEDILMVTAGHYDKATASALLLVELITNGDRSTSRDLLHTSTNEAAAFFTLADLEAAAARHLARRVFRPRAPTDVGALDVAVAVEQRLAAYKSCAQADMEEPGDAADTAFSHLRAAFDALTAFHVTHFPKVYTHAIAEVDRYISAAASKAANATAAKADRRSGPYLTQLRTAIDREARQHRDAFENTKSYVTSTLLPSLLEAGAPSGIDAVRFVHECLLPRAMLSFEDATFVVAFVELLLLQCAALLNNSDLTVPTSNADGPSPQLVRNAAGLHRSLIDSLLTFITASTATTVVHSPAEAKRLGVAVKNSLQVLRSSLVPAACVVTPKCALSFRAKLGSLPPPPELLRIEAYLAQVYFPVLADTRNIPQFVHRNALQQLDRLKDVFPSSVVTTRIMRRAVEAHNNRRSPLFAMASAISRHYEVQQARLEAALASGSGSGAAAASAGQREGRLEVMLADLIAAADAPPPEETADVEDDAEDDEMAVAENDAAEEEGADAAAAIDDGDGDAPADVDDAASSVKSDEDDDDRDQAVAASSRSSSASRSSGSGTSRRSASNSDSDGANDLERRESTSAGAAANKRRKNLPAPRDSDDDDDDDAGDGGDVLALKRARFDGADAVLDEAIVE